MKLGGLLLGEAVNCFCLLFVFPAVPSESAQAKTTSGCASLTQSVTLNLTCNSGQHISIYDVLAGAPAVDCRVNRRVECIINSPNITQLPQVIACNGLGSCNVTVNFFITCSTKPLSLYAVEILYWCLEQSAMPQTESMTRSTMSSRESMTGSTMSPTESVTGSTMSPTESVTGSTMSPTEVMTETTMSTTETTTGSKSKASVPGVVLMVLSVLLGVVVIMALMGVCFLCVYRKQRKGGESSRNFPNTTKHLDHVRAPANANRCSAMISGNECMKVVPMSRLENTEQITDDGYWQLGPTDVLVPIAVQNSVFGAREGDSPVQNSVSQWGSVYAQLEVPRGTKGSTDYWEVEVGVEDSITVVQVQSDVNCDEVMLPEQSLQNSPHINVAAPPTDHFDGAYVDGACVDGAYVDGAYVDGAYVDGAYVDGAYVDGAYVDGACVDGACVDGAYVDDAYVDGACVDGACVDGAYVDGAYVDGAYVDGAYVDGACVVSAYVDDAYVDGAYVDGAYVDGACVDGACVDGAYVDDAYVDGACVDGACVDGAYVDGAYVDGAYVDGAYVDGACVVSAYVDDAYVDGAYVNGAYVDSVCGDGADCGVQLEQPNEVNEEHRIPGHDSAASKMDVAESDPRGTGALHAEIADGSATHKPISNYDHLVIKPTEGIYTPLEQQELNVHADTQRKNKNYYFETEPQHLKHERDVDFDKTRNKSKTTDSPYNHLSLSTNEQLVDFTTDCDLHEQCERSTSTQSCPGEHVAVTEVEENSKDGHDTREPTQRNNKHDYFELEPRRFTHDIDANVTTLRENISEYIKHTTDDTSEIETESPYDHLKSNTKQVSTEVLDIIAHDISPPEVDVSQTSVTDRSGCRDQTPVIYDHLTSQDPTPGTNQYNEEKSLPRQTEERANMDYRDALYDPYNHLTSQHPTPGTNQYKEEQSLPRQTEDRVDGDNRDALDQRKTETTRKGKGEDFVSLDLREDIGGHTQLTDGGKSLNDQNVGYGGADKEHDGNGVYAGAGNGNVVYAVAGDGNVDYGGADKEHDGNGVYAVAGDGNVGYGDAGDGNGVYAVAGDGNVGYGGAGDGNGVYAVAGDGNGVYAVAGDGNVDYGGADKEHDGNGVNAVAGDGNVGYGGAGDGNGVYAVAGDGNVVNAVAGDGNVGYGVAGDGNGVCAVAGDGNVVYAVAGDGNVGYGGAGDGDYGDERAVDQNELQSLFDCLDTKL